MALVKCPVCSTRMSTLAKTCPKCGFSHEPEQEIDTEQAKLHRKRRFSQRVYQLKMMSYVAMTIAMIGAIPMLWAYIKGIEEGNNVVLLSHWGSYLIAAGFLFYVVVRIAMILNRKKFRNG